MALQYVGELPLGVMCAAASTAVGVSLRAWPSCSLRWLSTSKQLSSVQSRWGLSPPNIGIDLALCAQLLIDLNLAISVSLPSLDFQIAAVLALIASYPPSWRASLSLSLSLPLAELFATAGIQAYQYSGSGGQFGGLLNQAISEFFPDGTPQATPSTRSCWPLRP